MHVYQLRSAVEEAAQDLCGEQDMETSYAAAEALALDGLPDGWDIDTVAAAVHASAAAYHAFDRGAALCPECDDENPECLRAWCALHGEVKVVPLLSGTFSGMAGGRVYHVTYSCGCNDHDDSDDARAAQ